MDPGTVSVIVGIFTAIATAAGSFIYSLVKARSSAKTGELVELRTLIDGLQTTNTELWDENRKLREELAVQLTRINELAKALDEERRKRTVLSERVIELSQENNKLHERIGALQELASRKPGAEVMKLVRRVSEALHELHEKAKDELDPWLLEKLNNIITLADGIPALLEETAG